MRLTVSEAVMRTAADSMTARYLLARSEAVMLVIFPLFGANKSLLSANIMTSHDRKEAFEAR